MSDGVTIDGLDELVSRMRSLARRAPKAAAKGLHRGALIVMNRSKRIVPVDTGRLRASGFIESPKYGTRGVSVRLGYGTKYAVFVHEGTKYMDGRKFLSRAIQERQRAVVEQIVKAVEKEIGK